MQTMPPFDRAKGAGIGGQSNQTAGASFSTEDLPPSLQFDAYKTYCAPVIDIAPGETSRSGYGASCDMWTLGPLTLRRIQAPAATFARSAAQIRRDGLDHWVFNLTRQGRQEARTSGGTLCTDAGELSVFSLAGAYEARRTNVDWIGLFVPRGAFPAIDAAFRHDHHVCLDTPLGRLLGAFLTSLADELPAMAQGDLSRAIDATQALVGSCAVGPSAMPQDSSDAQLDMPRLRRVRDIIDRNLGTWNLHTERVCKLAGVSRSNLYRMFEPYGGVMRYVQRQRLLRAHDLLSDPGCTQRISSVANNLCFADAAAFSRAFRCEFGYPPRDLRGRAGSGATAGTRPPRQTPAAGAWAMLYRI